jgi:CRISPR/Cas system-associated exonuclease Cas4 (RecB family)
MAASRLFDPSSDNPFPLSRSKVELYLDCPRCFYLDRRLGVGRPAGFPFNLNAAVDALLKREFDDYRAQGKTHPLMAEAGINAVPHAHPELETWRSNFKGVRTLHERTNLELFGAIDDLWRDLASGELIVADYKATSKAGEVGIDAEWQVSYKRQMEFYQWLLRSRGHKVAKRGWFVYCNGRRDLPAFDSRLEFTIRLLPHDGDDTWVEATLAAIRETLAAPEPPPPGAECEYCVYVERAAKPGDGGRRQPTLKR